MCAGLRARFAVRDRRGRPAAGVGSSMRRPTCARCSTLARDGGDDIFLVYEDERLSFNDVFAQIDALGDALVNRYGISKGDRVAIGMRNYPEWVMSTLAIISVGAVSVALNALWVEDELDYALEDCGASLLIADVERIGRAIEPCRRLGIRMLEVRADSPSADDVDQWNDVVVPGPAMPAVDVGWDDDATILYTSGTTGRPKGAVSTNGAIVSSAMAFGSRAAADARTGRSRGSDRRNAAAGADTGLHPDRAAVPRHRFRARDAQLRRPQVEAGDDVPLERGEGARADRARARHQLRRRTDAELGPGQLAALRRVRHIEPARCRWWRCARADGVGRACRRQHQERRPDPRLRHDRDQRVRSTEHRRRLHQPPDVDRSGDADHADRGPRSSAPQGAERRAWRDLVRRTRP